MGRGFLSLVGRASHGNRITSLHARTRRHHDRLGTT